MGHVTFSIYAHALKVLERKYFRQQSLDGFQFDAFPPGASRVGEVCARAYMCAEWIVGFIIGFSYSFADNARATHKSETISPHIKRIHISVWFVPCVLLGVRVFVSPYKFGLIPFSTWVLIDSISADVLLVAAIISIRCIWIPNDQTLTRKKNQTKKIDLYCTPSTPNTAQ